MYGRQIGPKLHESQTISEYLNGGPHRHCRHPPLHCIIRISQCHRLRAPPNGYSPSKHIQDEFRFVDLKTWQPMQTSMENFDRQVIALIPPPMFSMPPISNEEYPTNQQDNDPHLFHALGGIVKEQYIR